MYKMDLNDNKNPSGRLFDCTSKNFLHLYEPENAQKESSVSFTDKAGESVHKSYICQSIF
jgi:putative heme degradation protein